MDKISSCYWPGAPRHCYSAGRDWEWGTAPLAPVTRFSREGAGPQPENCWPTVSSRLEAPIKCQIKVK